MNTPVRTTLFYALIAGLIYSPLSWGLGGYLYTPSILQMVLGCQLAIYAVMLARWSHTRIVAISFPLFLLLIAALLPGPYIGFLVLALAILSWIRSGICFSGQPMRLLVAEGVTVLGGLALILFLIGPSPLSWSLGISLFGLVQALYFFIVPTSNTKAYKETTHDPFEDAYIEAQKIVGVN